MKILKPFKTLWRMTPFSGPDKPLVNVIELTGAIGMGSGPMSKRSLNMNSMEKTIEEAFKPDRLAAIALSINSPGGSPVQSRLIFCAIRRHAETKKVPVFAFIEDIGASAGYLLALAADEIYADDSSIVGSIGVISAGFGFPDLLAKYGIERRVYTAGTNKGQLDSFAPENKEDVARFQTLLDEAHMQFTSLVKERRGHKVETGHDDTFTGLFWTASGAKERGLVDGLSQLTDFMYERFGEHVKIQKCKPKEGGLFTKLFGACGFARKALVDNQGHAGGPQGQIGQTDQLGQQGLIDPEAVLSTLEERALWARFGL